MDKIKEQDIKHKDNTDKNSDSLAQAEHRQEVLDNAPKRAEKFAPRAFTALNYGGVNWLLNSVISLAITYNIMSTKGAKNFVNIISKGFMPIAKGWKKTINLFGANKPINPKSVEASARSTAETTMMMIAGFIILPPMQWLENRKKEIVDKIDHLRNPKYHKYVEKNGIEPEPLPYEKKEEKHTMKDLISARLASLVAILGVDAAIQGVNNSLAEKGRGNLDTAEWKLGNKIYDKFPNFSKKASKFFSVKGKGIEGIQESQMENLQKTIKTNDPNRLVFAEQSRFVSKEFLLTAIFSTIMFTVAKTGGLGKMLNKLGFKTERKQQKAIDDMLPDIPFVPITRGEIDLDGDGKIGNEKYTDKIKPRDNIKTLKERENTSFTDRHLSESLTNQQLAMQP
ncbi:MAG: hypothetical protein R3D71_08625 [Rickettsiales bacterium]